LIRGLDPKPGAWTTLPGDGKRETGNGELKLFGVRVEEGHGAPGEVLTADGRLLIATGSGAVEVAEVQPAGKVRMAVADWVRGRRRRPARRSESRPRARAPFQPQLVDRQVRPRLAGGARRTGGWGRLSFSGARFPNGDPPNP